MMSKVKITFKYGVVSEFELKPDSTEWLKEFLKTDREIALGVTEIFPVPGKTVYIIWRDVMMVEFEEVRDG